MATPSSANRATPMAESLSDIKTDLMRLDDLLQDYLSLLQLESLDLTPTELGAVIQPWVVAWQGLAEDRRVRLEARGLEQLGTGAQCARRHAAGGTGLGLYLVQQIVAAHQGQVGVQSLEGEGTTFTITWPRHAAE